MLRSAATASNYASAQYKSSESVDRECEVYAQHIDAMLSKTLNDGIHLPVSKIEGKSKCDSLLNALRDGVVLGYIINVLDESILPVKRLHHNIDMTKVGKQQSKSLFEVGENLNMVVDAAKKMNKHGIVVVNCGANDIMEKNVDVVLGLVWQLIRAYLLKDVNLVQRPELIRLLKDGESIKDLLDMKSDALLLRWFNFHLAKAYHPVINYFSKDITDGAAYAVLLDQVAPRSFSRQGLLDKSMDAKTRIVNVIDFAREIGCEQFIQSKDVISGHSRLNLAFVAGIFNKYIGIKLPSDDEVRQLYNTVEDLEAENAELKEMIRSRDDRLAAMESEISSLHLSIETSKLALHSKNEQSLQSLRVEYEKKLDDQKTQLKQQNEQRESELLGMLDIIKAKQKQQIYQQERQFERVKSQATRDLNQIKRSIESFLIENKVIESQDTDNTPLEQLPEVLQDRLVKLLQTYYTKADELTETNKKLARARQVNDIYGDKIQEYAEGLIVDQKRGSGADKNNLNRMSSVRTIFKRQSAK
ncbi:hypothetical protein MIR68_001646 [Amoeboaphelidium protococcarum]|nr:hypothetical protein MIR68_001646 [Amoeboaphelidium protococcarum]